MSDPQNAQQDFKAQELQAVQQCQKHSLNLTQLRVIRLLKDCKGALTRATISDRLGFETHIMVGRVVGYSDPKKREAFRNTEDGKNMVTLLDQEIVREVVLDLDGVTELCLELTTKGREVAQATAYINLPPKRKSSHGPDSESRRTWEERGRVK